MLLMVGLSLHVRLVVGSIRFGVTKAILCTILSI